MDWSVVRGDIHASYSDSVKDWDGLDEPCHSAGSEKIKKKILSQFELSLFEIIVFTRKKKAYPTISKETLIMSYYCNQTWQTKVKMSAPKPALCPYAGNTS